MVDVAEPWTPGPWKAEYSRAKAAWWIRYSPVRVPGDDSIYRIVAESDSEADARLIALAPEMAEALQQVVAISEHFAADDDTPGWLRNWFAKMSGQFPGDGPPAPVLTDLLARARGSA